MMDWSVYQNFAEDEFRCRGRNCCGGQASMDIGFMGKLQTIRSILKFPFVITSGFRCEEHDRDVGGAGVHPTGHAADIAISRRQAYDLLRLAINMFWGIGISQKGRSRFIHIDSLVSDKHPRPAIWTY